MKRLFPSAVVALGVLVPPAAAARRRRRRPPRPIPTFTATLSPANEVPRSSAPRPPAPAPQHDAGHDEGQRRQRDRGDRDVRGELSGFPAGTPINISHIHAGAATGVNGARRREQRHHAGQSRADQRVGLVHRLEPDRRIRRGEPDPRRTRRGFYFNVHSTLNPGGVARGQLVRAQSRDYPRHHARAVRGGRRRSGRHDAGVSAGACRRSRRRARKARRFPPRFSRRHHPSFDARGDVRARAARRVPEAAAPGSAPAHRPRRRRERDHRRLHAPADPLQVPGADAAVGLPRFPRRAGAHARHLRAADGDRGHRADRGGRPRRRRPRRRRRAAARRSAPISSSAPTAGTRSCASAPA